MYVDQVLTILLMKQLSSVSIKYSRLSIMYSNVYRSSTHNSIEEATLICIDQVLTYQSSTHIYQSSTHVYRSNTSMYVDQVLTILLTKQLLSVPIKYSCLSIKYSNVYRSSTHNSIEEATLICIDQVLTYQSSTHIYQSSTHVYRSITSMYVDQVLTILSMKQLSSVLIKY